VGTRLRDVAEPEYDQLCRVSLLPLGCAPQAYRQGFHRHLLGNTSSD